MTDYLTIALPKGRLFEQTQQYFSEKGIHFNFDRRKLIAYSEEAGLKFFLVKNSDLPTYVHHGIAGLGICGDDVLYESAKDFIKLFQLPFGSTDLCLAASADNQDMPTGKMIVATKFLRFTQNYFHTQGQTVKMIELNGSVELAPLLGLAPYIVDLVETGNTLRANNLEVIKKLKKVFVHLIANPAYFKIHYTQIGNLLEILKNE